MYLCFRWTIRVSCKRELKNVCSASDDSFGKEDVWRSNSIRVIKSRYCGKVLVQ
jgi:hypothetical protein